MPLWMMEKGRDYFSWILPALAGCRELAPLYERCEIPDGAGVWEKKEGNFTLQIITPEELTVNELQRRVSRKMSKERLSSWDGQEVFDGGFREQLKERFSYVYPYESQKDLPVKVTVSELKAREQEEAAQELYFEPDIIPLIPRFISEKEPALTGAERGTAYHRALELLDYTGEGTLEDIKAQLLKMETQGKLTKEMRRAVDPRDLAGLRRSRLGERMAKASEEGRLFREQPFTMGLPADIGILAGGQSQKETEDTVLIQGIIDAYFYEGDGIVLVDYKTDHIYREEILREKYKKQLDYYKEVLERTTGKKVKEEIIYSFTMGRSIVCEEIDDGGRRKGEDNVL